MGHNRLKSYFQNRTKPFRTQCDHKLSNYFWNICCLGNGVRYIAGLFEEGPQPEMIFPAVLTFAIGLFKIVSAEPEDNGPVVQLNGQNFDQVFHRKGLTLLIPFSMLVVTDPL